MASPTELRERWLTRDGAARRESVLRRLRANEPWAEALDGFVLAHEVAHNEDLRGIDFSDEDLREVALDFAELSFANLTGCHLFHAHMQQVRLVGATLVRADLRSAMLTGLDASDANFDHADLRHAFLDAGILCRASFRQSRLLGADLSRSNLIGTSVEGWSAQGADTYAALRDDDEPVDAPPAAIGDAASLVMAPHARALPKRARVMHGKRAIAVAAGLSFSFLVVVELRARIPRSLASLFTRASSPTALTSASTSSAPTTLIQQPSTSDATRPLIALASSNDLLRLSDRSAIDELQLGSSSSDGTLPGAMSDWFASGGVFAVKRPPASTFDAERAAAEKLIAFGGTCLEWVDASKCKTAAWYGLQVRMPSAKFEFSAPFHVRDVWFWSIVRPLRESDVVAADEHAHVYFTHSSGTTDECEQKPKAGWFYCKHQYVDVKDVGVALHIEHCDSCANHVAVAVMGAGRR